jgi:hypothetical protein
MCLKAHPLLHARRLAENGPNEPLAKTTTCADSACFLLMACHLLRDESPTDGFQKSAMAGSAVRADSVVLVYFAALVDFVALAGAVLLGETELAVYSGCRDAFRFQVDCPGYSLAGLPGYRGDCRGCIRGGCHILDDFPEYRGDTRDDSRRDGYSQVCCRDRVDGSWADDNPNCHHNRDDYPKV